LFIELWRLSRRNLFVVKFIVLIKIRVEFDGIRGESDTCRSGFEFSAEIVVDLLKFA
jgi:hypothetical protein